MRKYVSVGLMFSFLVSMLAPVASAEKSNGNGSGNGATRAVLFDSGHRSLEKWRDTWDDGSPAGAKIEVDGNYASVIGTSNERNYGTVYQHIDWDLDKYPYLEVDSAACNTDWYIIVENPNFETGYIKVEEGTRQIGKRAYNIRKACGLKGLRRIRLEIGLTTNERPANKGLSAKFSSIRLASKTDARIIPPPVLQTGSDAEAQESASLGWNSRWDSGGSAGAFLAKGKDKTLKLVGASSDQCYGCVYKAVDVDFADYPSMEVSVRNLTAQMYIIFEGPQFRGGYYRLKPVILQPGQYVFNVGKELDYLQGPQSFVVKLGVTTDNPQIPNKGREIEFYTVKFVGKGNMKLLAGFVSSQLIAPPPPLAVPQPAVNRPLGNEFKKKSEGVDKGSLFSLYGDAYKVKATTVKNEDPAFTDSGDRLIVGNANYEVTLNRQTGALISMLDKAHNSQVSLGSEQPYLWRLMFKNEDYMNAQDFIAGPGGRFTYEWLKSSNTLRLNYERGASQMLINLEFTRQNYFDLSASFRNGEDKIVTAVDMPKVCFDYRKMDRFYFPWGIGVAFNQKFFKDKRQMKTNYPKLFSDFVSWTMRDGGQLAIYLLWADKPIMATRVNVGYSPAKGESGAFEHGWVTYIHPRQSWVSQPLRFVFGEQVEVALKHYKKDNKLTKASLAVDKLGRALFNKVTNGVLLKISLDLNRDFEYLKKYYDDLPKGTIIHYVTWWLEGFDRHMPDYWPVDPTYGNDADFKQSVALAKSKGMATMPYTNPTFWNTCPTLKKLGGPEEVASKNLKGEVIFEVYPSGGSGWATSPRHPDVKKNMEFVTDKFFKEYKMDMLFLDQIGARFVYYDTNSTLGNPADYCQAWLERVQENVKRGGPLYTEQGYDRLVPYIAGFCGLVSFTFPESKDHNSWWGENSWEYFPMAQYLSHENVLFYHHNLAHEVFADSDKKISFYLVQGYNMYTARWVSQWANQKKWFYVIDRLQKSIASRYAGKPLLNFSQPEPQRLYWAAYPDLGILANISDVHEKNVLNHTVAKNGFIATNRTGTFLAGLFTRLYGFRLAKEQYLIIETTDKKITVQQLQAQSSLLTVPRPAHWKLDEAISVYQGSNKVVLVATTPQTVTFYTDGSVASDGPVTYSVEYDSGYKPPCSVNIRIPQGTASANTEVNLGMEALNLTSGRLDNARLVLSAWLVKRNMPVIDAKAGYLTLAPDQNFKTKPVSIMGNGYLSAEFPLQIPSTASAGDMVWLKGELVTQGSKGQTVMVSQSIIPVVSPFEITVQPAKEKMTADAQTTVEVMLKNNFSSAVKGDLELDIPANWTGANRRSVTVAPGATSKNTFTVNTPALDDKKVFELSASFKVDKNVTETTPVKVEVVPLWRVLSIEGIRMLVPGQKSKCVLRLIAQPEKAASGTIVLSPSSGLLLERKEIPFNVPEGGYQNIEFNVTAMGNSDQSMTIEVRAQEGTKTISVEYPVVKAGDARALAGDLMNRGDHDILMGNSEVEIQAQREMGGRILNYYYRKSGANMLYQNYPNINRIEGDGNWIEYGGLNDWFPEGWPGYVWNDVWTAQIIKGSGDEAVVKMTTQTKNGLLLERTFVLPGQGRKLRIDYKIRNLTDVPRKYLWYNHPDLCPGPDRYAGENHRIIVPIADPKKPGKETLSITKFIGKIGKDTYVPNAGWVVALNQGTKDYFMQMFDPDQVKEIGVWQDANFYTMELLSKEEKLGPGESRGFTIYYIVGNNDWKEELK